MWDSSSVITYSNTNKVTLRQRLCLVTWGWFTISMSTGGLSILLYNQPHQFTGLKTIGKVFYIMNLVIFLFICSCLTLRFTANRSALRESFQSPTESYFIGTFMLAIATILMGASDYGSPSCGPWLQVALRVLFWIYLAVSFIAAIGLNICHFHFRMGMKEKMAIVRVLPYFPTMLGGTVASVLAQHQPPKHAITMTIAGITMQGLGFLVSLFVYSEYVYNLSRDGLPDPAIRPEMFIAVGPLSFTAIAFIGAASVAQQLFPAHYIEAAKTVNTADVAMVLAAFSSIFMWLLAFFFFSLAIMSLLAIYRSLHFSLVWWSCIFPNTGFIIATIRIGTVLHSPGILWVSSAMTIVLVAAWFIVGGLTIWSTFARRLLWPSDKEK